MATGAHFRWPSARSFVAAYAQFLMAADNPSPSAPVTGYYSVLLWPGSIAALIANLLPGASRAAAMQAALSQ
jgi:hypothetical protein